MRKREIVRKGKIVKKREKKKERKKRRNQKRRKMEKELWVITAAGDCIFYHAMEATCLREDLLPHRNN